MSCTYEAAAECPHPDLRLHLVLMILLALAEALRPLLEAAIQVR